MAGVMSHENTLYLEYYFFSGWDFIVLQLLKVSG